jgi:uncharacterized protein YdeI (YjbR/CyaY-like superfamily)
MAEKAGALPEKLFKDLEAWEKWLSTHGGRSPGVWLKVAKGDSGLASVSYQQALEAALCHGWIDGQKKPLDERFWLQKFTPRGPRSIWSRINREKAISLSRQGRMKPAGLAAMEAAKASGRWDAAYDSQKTAGVPADLQEALGGNPAAMSFFKTLNSRNRYAILFRIQSVKKAETRQKKIAAFVAMLERHEKIYP